MSERLIILAVPPPASLREQDASDLEMLVAGLKWREGADLNDPEEFGPLSGDRWHVVLRQFLDEKSDNRKRQASELEYLLKILEHNGTTRQGTERRWADILRRMIRDDYEAPVGRPKLDVRDRLLSRHYWLIRRIYPSFSEDDCADSVALAFADTGGLMSASRIKRIAKSAQNKSNALQWIDDQTNTFTKHAPDVVLRALLATFEPTTADMKVLTRLSRREVK